MKTAREELLEWVEKKAAKEKDKWLSGMKNNWFQWEDLRTLIREKFDYESK